MRSGVLLELPQSCHTMPTCFKSIWIKWIYISMCIYICVHVYTCWWIHIQWRVHTRTREQILLPPLKRIWLKSSRASTHWNGSYAIHMPRRLYEIGILVTVYYAQDRTHTNLYKSYIILPSLYWNWKK